MAVEMKKQTIVYSFCWSASLKIIMYIFLLECKFETRIMNVLYVAHFRPCFHAFTGIISYVSVSFRDAHKHESTRKPAQRTPYAKQLCVQVGFQLQVLDGSVTIEHYGRQALAKVFDGHRPGDRGPMQPVFNLLFWSLSCCLAVFLSIGPQFGIKSIHNYFGRIECCWTRLDNCKQFLLECKL